MPGGLRGGIGSLHQRVQIQKATETRDDYGEVIRTYNTVATRWAKIEDLSGREPFDNARVENYATHMVTVRWYEPLDGAGKNDFRFIYKGMAYNIEAIDNKMKRDRVLICECVENTNEAAEGVLVDGDGNTLVDGDGNSLKWV